MIQLKPFRQSPGFCGPASLKMILEHYGINKTEQELAELCGATRDLGVDAQGIAKACGILGLNAAIIDNAEIEDIQKKVVSGTPVIVQWFSNDEGHWSVVVDVDDENICLQDPHHGMLRAFKKSWFRGVWFDFHKGVMEKENLVLRRMVVIERK